MTTALTSYHEEQKKKKRKIVKEKLNKKTHTHVLRVK